MDPIFVTRIEDNQGNLIYSAVPHRTEVTSEDAYYKIVSILLSMWWTAERERVHVHATASARRWEENRYHQPNSDSWFMGFTPDLVTGVWVGGEEKIHSLQHHGFRTGSAGRAPIYGLFMQKVYADPKLPYPRTQRLNSRTIVELCGKFFESDGSV